MPFGALFFLIVYTAALSYITVYCLLQFDLLFRYLRAGKRTADELAQRERLAGARKAAMTRSTEVRIEAGPPAAGDPASEAWPMVTIQLPIFNEKYVVERLLEHVGALDYPKDRLQVQVLDDSTDETIDITRRKVEAYLNRGFRMEVVRRQDRQGYKAGALRDAMPTAEGAFVAIFDADFMPRPDFLRQTLPYFADPSVAVVQTRWEHINQSYSLLTRLQALQLNVHFSVEQGGRMRGDYLLQFNGTAGIWRKTAIEEAGGWQADTLTEDLDLSIRAQLRGWKVHYLEAVGTPAELPVDMPSLKSQQFRWMKGGAETARKLMPRIWRARLGLWKTIQATFHLLASSIFMVILLAGVSSIPLVFMLEDLRPLGIDRHFFAYFLIGLLSISGVYFVANVLVRPPAAGRVVALGQFLWRFPLFLALSMGLSLHNSWAVWQGWVGRRSPFVRTPKLAIERAGESFRRKSYRLSALSGITWLEGMLALVFGGAAVAGLWLDKAMFFGFHLMLAVGYGTIFLYTVGHTRSR